jgi:hypothetical protein
VLGGIDGSGLDKSQNQLLYPNSTYDNLLKSIPVSSSSLATSQAATLISTSEISLTRGALSPSAIPTCDVGHAIFEYPGGMFTCGLDTSYRPVCYNPEGTCFNEICSASSDCGTTKTCLPNGYGASEAQCAQVLVACLDSPQITEIVFSLVETSN